MAFYDCLQRAVAAKEISTAEAETLFSRYDRFRRAKGGGPTADAEAKQLLAEALAGEAARKKTLSLLGALHLSDLDQKLDAHVNSKGAPDLAGATERLFEHFGDAKFSSIEGQKRYVLGQAQRRMEGVLHEFRRSALLGDNLNVGSARLTFRKNQARLQNVVREAYGDAHSDQAARALFKSWSDTAEWLRQQFNALGGAIPKIEGGWMPQSHDALALIRAGREPWKDFVRTRLDWDKMRHPESGQSILPDEIEDVLDDVFESITTEGWNKREPMRRAQGKGALANRFNESRFLHFRTAKDYLDYADQFGEGDVFAAMMGHVNQMSRDIATLKVLGPNPGGTLEYLKGRINEAYRGIGPEANSRANKAIDRLDALYAIVRGESETPVSTGFANVFAGARNLITSSVLGSASITALSDIGFQQMARKFNGLKETGIVRDYVSHLRTAPRREAVRAGLINDAAAHTFHRQARYVGMYGGPQWTQWLADRTITWSGLSPWTQAGKHAFGMSLMGHMADQMKRPFAKLGRAEREMLARWGFDAARWDLIRKSKPYVPARGSGGLLRAQDIADDALAAKWGEMVLMETEYAVPSGSIRGKAMLGASGAAAKPGTFIGEIIRTGLQFKGFGLALMMLQGTRIGMIAGGSKPRGALYAAKLLLWTTLYGAMAMQIKDVVNGRDPRPMDSLEFWGSSMLQGGGWGLYGDFLFADLNRFGRGMADTLTGPLVGRLDDARNFTFGNLAEAASGEDTKMGKEFVNGVKNNAPFQSIWWLRLAGASGLMDQLNYLVDPEAQEGFARKMRQRERDYGQGFWRQPGKALPQRGPDFGNIQPAPKY